VYDCAAERYPQSPSVDSSHPNFKQISGLIKEEKERTKASLEALAPVSKY